jgi:hypothetical protein
MEGDLQKTPIVCRGPLSSAEDPYPLQRTPILCKVHGGAWPGGAAVAHGEGLANRCFDRVVLLSPIRDLNQVRDDWRRNKRLVKTTAPEHEGMGAYAPLPQQGRGRRPFG